LVLVVCRRRGDRRDWCTSSIGRRAGKGQPRRSDETSGMSALPLIAAECAQFPFSSNGDRLAGQIAMRLIGDPDGR
jgi:hypothetical protein